MKSYLITLLLGWVILSTSLHAQNQPKDTLDFIEHSGIIHLVKDKKTLPLSELKAIVKNNPAAFAHFKKARRIRNLGFAFETISSGFLVWGLITQNDTETLICAGGTLLFTSLNLAFLPDPYNKALLNCLKEYNR